MLRVLWNEGVNRPLVGLNGRRTRFELFRLVVVR
jgi:hypothetical protein